MASSIPNSATLTLFVDLGSPDPEDALLVRIRFALAYATQKPADYFQQPKKAGAFDREDAFMMKRSEQRIFYVCASYPQEQCCMNGWKEQVVNKLIDLMEKAIKKMPKGEREKVRISLHDLKKPKSVRTDKIELPYTALSKFL